ncbi:MAG: hypothetical protein Fues2KO_24270 [Fuerstiella sp.]
MDERSESDWKQLGFMLGTVFRPGTPVNREDLFSGRTAPLRRVVDTINQHGQHSVIYGERGVGKTSLANMLWPTLHATGCSILIPVVNCGGASTYASIWKSVFSEILTICEKKDLEMHDRTHQIMSAFTEPYGDGITEDVVRRILDQLGERYIVVVVIDEIDTIRDDQTRAQLADTIKLLSDRNVSATIVLIGVADDVNNLISNHMSVERCLRQVHLPRMSRDELEEVVTNGLAGFDMTIDQDALHETSRLARGLPHYAHLMGLSAGRSAVDRKSMTVSKSDVKNATKEAIESAQASTINSYVNAVSSARKDALFEVVLLASAMAKTDELGFFFASDVQGPLSLIRGKECPIDTYSRHLNAFCNEDRGCVLEAKKTASSTRYRFTNPILEPYVLIKGVASGAVSEKLLAETRDLDDPQLRLF